MIRCAVQEVRPKIHVFSYRDNIFALLNMKNWLRFIKNIDGVLKKC